MAQLQAVIFDYGLVLSDPAVPEAWARLLEITGLAPADLEKYYWKYRLDYDRGTLNGRTYWAAIARDTNLNLTEPQISALIAQDVRLWASINPVMLSWVERVRAAGFKIAILSNMGEDLLAHMRQHFRWLEQFHHLTWSCELDMVKPEAGIYTHTLERLGVAAQDALFLDDKPENIEGARRVGLHALQFTTPEKLQADLDREGWAAQLPQVL